MASVIIHRTISSATDSRIQLSNSRFARQIPFSWSKIRLGVRWTLNATTGVNITGTPRIVLGICAGSSNIYGDATTTHFLGARQNESTWTAQGAAGSENWFCNGSTWQNLKRVGTTDTTGTSLGLNAITWNIAHATLARRSIFFLDITKGSPNFTQRIFGTNANPPADITESRFLELMGIELPSETNYQHATAQTLAVSEGTDGTFTHLNVHWDRTTQNIEISDIALARFA